MTPPQPASAHSPVTPLTCGVIASLSASRDSQRSPCHDAAAAADTDGDVVEWSLSDTVHDDDAASQLPTDIICAPATTR